MCTLYNQGKLLRTNQLSEDLIAEFTEHVKLLKKVQSLRPTEPGVVVARGKEGNLRAVTMRWGWTRPDVKIVVNSRDDKLNGRMWAKADRERRCLVPAESFCEWSGGKGAKIQHWFRADDGLPLWIAGLWENSKEHGLCYTMVTRSPFSPVAEVHDRMPAVLTATEAFQYLDEQLPANAGTQPLVPLGADLLFDFRSIRKCPVEPGMRGWASTKSGGGVTTDLDDRTPITIISRKDTIVQVKTDDGQIWKLSDTQCDTGCDYLFGDQWYPENDPKALDYLEALFRDGTEKLGRTTPGSHQEMVVGNLDRVAWILQRNGRGIQGTLIE